MQQSNFVSDVLDIAVPVEYTMNEYSCLLSCVKRVPYSMHTLE